MIEPKILQLLPQLVFAVNRSNEFCLHQLVYDLLLVLERQGTRAVGLLRLILQALLVLVYFNPQAFGRDIGRRIFFKQACGGKA